MSILSSSHLKTPCHLVQLSCLNVIIILCPLTSHNPPFLLHLKTSCQIMKTNGEYKAGDAFPEFDFQIFPI